MKSPKGHTLELPLNEVHQDQGQRAAPELERNAGDGSLESAQFQAEGSKRFLVLVTSYRRKLLDEDNLCEKYHVDCCRYAGWLPSDAPRTTEIKTRQVLVKDDEDIRTEIEIIDRFAPDDDAGTNKGITGG